MFQGSDPESIGVVVSDEEAPPGDPGHADCRQRHHRGRPEGAAAPLLRGRDRPRSVQANRGGFHLQIHGPHGSAAARHERGANGRKSASGPNIGSRTWIIEQCLEDYIWIRTQGRPRRQDQRGLDTDPRLISCSPLQQSSKIVWFDDAIDDWFDFMDVQCYRNINDANLKWLCLNGSALYNAYEYDEPKRH